MEQEINWIQKTSWGSGRHLGFPPSMTPTTFPSYVGTCESLDCIWLKDKLEEFFSPKSFHFLHLILGFVSLPFSHFFPTLLLQLLPSLSGNIDWPWLLLWFFLVLHYWWNTRQSFWISPAFFPYDKSSDDKTLSSTLPWKLIWVTYCPSLASVSPFPSDTCSGLTGLTKLHCLTLSLIGFKLRPSFLSEAEKSSRHSLQETGELSVFFNSAFWESCSELPPHAFPLETRTNNLHALFRSQGTLPKALWRWIV